MVIPKLKTSKVTVALWVVAGILAVSCGAYVLLLQGSSNLSKAAQEKPMPEKPIPQSQSGPQTPDESDTLDSGSADDPNATEQQTPPDGAQAPVGGHNMGAPPDAPPLKEVKQP